MSVSYENLYYSYLINILSITIILLTSVFQFRQNKRQHSSFGQMPGYRVGKTGKGSLKFHTRARGNSQGCLPVEVSFILDLGR
jgi:hypothetical protein